MKKRRLLTFFIALTLIFSSFSTTFAAQEPTLNESISFLNEHKDMLGWYYTMRFELITEKLSDPHISDEEKHQLTEEITSLKKAVENCLSGEHSYLIVINDTAGPPDCTTVGWCEYCGHTETVLTGNGYKERHSDRDSDGICDNCKREMPHLNCDHFCHNENLIVQKILLPLLKRLWAFFGTEEYCKCGTYHFD